MVRRGLLSAVLAIAILVVPAASAQATPPGNGSWTLLRKDAFLHYACKTWVPRANRWRVHTATWLNGNRSAVRHGIGSYAALARGHNRRIVASRQTGNWRGPHIRFALNGAVGFDRLWVQGAYYGPAAPWNDGVPVRRIGNCRG